MFTLHQLRWIPFSFILLIGCATVVASCPLGQYIPSLEWLLLRCGVASFSYWVWFVVLSASEHMESGRTYLWRRAEKGAWELSCLQDSSEKALAGMMVRLNGLKWSQMVPIDRLTSNTSPDRCPLHPFTEGGILVRALCLFRGLCPWMPAGCVCQGRLFWTTQWLMCMTTVNGEERGWTAAKTTQISAATPMTPRETIPLATRDDARWHSWMVHHGNHTGRGAGL